MVLGIPSIETRDERNRAADLAKAVAVVPEICLVLTAMLADEEDARPNASAVVGLLTAAYKKL
jgi:hypothetical protein